MLQRSPTYFRTGRTAIELAETLRHLQLARNDPRDRAAQDFFDQTFTRPLLANPTGNQ